MKTYLGSLILATACLFCPFFVMAKSAKSDTLASCPPIMSIEEGSFKVVQKINITHMAAQGTFFLENVVNFGRENFSLINAEFRTDSSLSWQFFYEQEESIPFEATLNSRGVDIVIEGKTHVYLYGICANGTLYMDVTTYFYDRHVSMTTDARFLSLGSLPDQQFQWQRIEFPDFEIWEKQPTSDGLHIIPTYVLTQLTDIPLGINDQRMTGNMYLIFSLSLRGAPD